MRYFDRILPDLRSRAVDVRLHHREFAPRHSIPSARRACAQAAQHHNQRDEVGQVAAEHEPREGEDNGTLQVEHEEGPCNRSPRAEHEDMQQEAAHEGGEGPFEPTQPWRNAAVCSPRIALCGQGKDAAIISLGLGRHERAAWHDARPVRRGSLPSRSRSRRPFARDRPSRRRYS
eukprot:scaffold15166_cov140-Isochrysis_galbana.AAC.2